MTCGEATVRLLAKYGVDTVFGIPGVHTLDFCRGLDKGEVRHIQTRNEQGAGFMAEGYARATGRPGVALVISGPGVTNAATAVGQCYADSLPMLLLSAEAASYTIGKGWGVLHEVPEQKAVTAPITALSATAFKAADVPELQTALEGHDGEDTWQRADGECRVVRDEIAGNLSSSEKQHVRLLEVLKDCAPAETVFAGDACQLVYTGAFAMPMKAPRKWFYPAGYCALGCALPNGIGAKLALPEMPVMVLAGDGGFMFTVQELIVAAELGLNLPIVVWENGGLKQIQDDMDIRDIDRVGVEGINPDFEMLAKACGCHAARPKDAAAFRAAIADALAADKPTLIAVTEGDGWLV